MTFRVIIENPAKTKRLDKYIVGCDLEEYLSILIASGWQVLSVTLVK